MKNMMCFIFGLVTAIVVIPVMEDVAQVAEGIATKCISKMNVNITQNQKEINDIQESCEPESTHAIGFTADWSEDGEDDDDSEE